MTVRLCWRRGMENWKSEGIIKGSGEGSGEVGKGTEGREKMVAWRVAPCSATSVGTTSAASRSRKRSSSLLFHASFPSAPLSPMASQSQVCPLAFPFLFPFNKLNSSINSSIHASPRLRSTSLVPVQVSNPYHDIMISWYHLHFFFSDYQMAAPASAHERIQAHQVYPPSPFSIASLINWIIITWCLRSIN